jgi:hypothetical protein
MPAGMDDVNSQSYLPLLLLTTAYPDPVSYAFNNGISV